MKYKAILFLLTVVLGFSSCFFQSNAIYFDIKEQAIKSCNSKGITRIYVEQVSTEKRCSIIWSDNDTNVPTTVQLSSISNGYTVLSGYPERRISNKEFKLQAFSKYIIERVQGDAGAYRIEVWTDGDGRVIKADPDSCPN